MLFNQQNILEFMCVCYLVTTIYTFFNYYYRVLKSFAQKKDIRVPQLILLFSLYSTVAPIYSVTWPVFLLFSLLSGKNIYLLSFGEEIDKIIK